MMLRTKTLLSLLLLSGAQVSVNGFVSPTAFTALSRQQQQQHQQQQQQQHQTTTALKGWEDIVYNAQSAGTNLAALSLKEASLSSLPIMYGAGLLASVSPCVWGLLPLTMSYISTAAGEREDKEATLPTLAFALGLASVFCTFGLIAASVGGVFGQQEGTTAIIVSVVSSGICLAMGLQLLNFVELPLPTLDFNNNSRNKLDSPTQILLGKDGTILPDPSSAAQKEQDQQGSLFRTFLLGGSSALVSSPCATPVLTSILAFVSNSHDPLLGAVLLLGYTLGYSTPLLLVASTGGQFLAQMQGGDYGKIAPWITPLTGGILLWYGTNGLLTTAFGDPSMVALAPILQ